MFHIINPEHLTCLPTLGELWREDLSFHSKHCHCNFKPPLSIAFSSFLICHSIIHHHCSSPFIVSIFVTIKLFDSWTEHYNTVLPTLCSPLHLPLLCGYCLLPCHSDCLEFVMWVISCLLPLPTSWIPGQLILMVPYVNLVSLHHNFIGIKDKILHPLTFSVSYSFLVHPEFAFITFTLILSTKIPFNA